ncbi:uncharacterized protein LOC132309056 [Cornus florida]|uniref:uncharacterized protein LOC132309056 n=1 Tax=Cornus florida TaxID=4283 RepID=UPI00289C1A15|nr:uncharacterized protein LOC132309056 [Cornus florida]
MKSEMEEGRMGKRMIEMGEEEMKRESNSSYSSSSSSEDDPFGALIQQDQNELYEIMNLVRLEIVEQVFQVRKKKQYIHHDREKSHYQLMKYYFNKNCTYPPEYFHKRFRMRRELFLLILNDVKAYNDYLVQKKDATGRLGLFSIQKMTTVIRILAYGCAADHYDEYIKIGESTTIKCLKAFCNAIGLMYAKEYMHPPNEADIARLLEEGEQRRFLGVLGSIDCMNWEWKNCPVEWHGTHKGRSGKNTLILEAVASQDLWIWHAFFGMTGSHNDINVLDHSSIFNGIVNGQLPPVNYVVNGHHYRMGYYLSNGIYPKWATLMQTIP